MKTQHWKKEHSSKKQSAEFGETTSLTLIQMINIRYMITLKLFHLSIKQAARYVSTTKGGSRIQLNIQTQSR